MGFTILTIVVGSLFTVGLYYFTVVTGTWRFAQVSDPQPESE